MNCRELTRMLASDLLADLPRSQRLGARVHVLFCWHCREYAAQLRGLGVAARSLWPSEAEDTETLERLEGEIRERLSKRSSI